ncbi:MAG TPA: hypothetical protein VJP78_13760 [Thermoleophilia bacterium]|nr:hypothetical protein [Thermoleophilia bacterium]
MAAKGLKRTKSKKPKDGKSAQAYDHKEEKLLLRPDVGLQPQFKQKKPPMTYHYDPSLDPALSWDINADCSHGRWAYRLIKSPTDTPKAIRSAGEELAST